LCGATTSAGFATIAEAIFGGVTGGVVDVGVWRRSRRWRCLLMVAVVSEDVRNLAGADGLAEVWAVAAPGLCALPTWPGAEYNLSCLLTASGKLYNL
jgi:hypothetical protein